MVILVMNEGIKQLTPAVEVGEGPSAVAATFKSCIPFWDVVVIFALQCNDGSL